MVVVEKQNTEHTREIQELYTCSKQYTELTTVYFTCVIFEAVGIACSDNKQRKDHLCLC